MPFRKGNRNLSLVIVLGIVAFGALAMFLYGLQDTRPVLVARRPLATGTRVEESLVEVRQMHASALLPGVLKDVKAVSGQTIVVARAIGDQITADMIGSKATSGIAASLAPDERAIAVNVTRASGMSGLLQTGDRVTAIGVLEPLNPSQKDSSPAAMVMLSGLRVLLVPQSFRYQERAPEATTRNGLSPALTNSQEQNKNVIVVAAPLTPQPLYPNGPLMSPVEILALLNEKGEIHLVLDPTQADYTILAGAVQLGDLIETAKQAQKAAQPTPAPKK